MSDSKEQKGFINIVLLVVVVAVVAAGGCFVLQKKSELATTSTTPSPSATSSNSTTSATSTGTQKVEVPKKLVEQKSTYPYSKYSSLSATKLEDLRKLFIERNGSNWSVELDEFGFIRDIKTSDPSLVSQDDSTKYNFTDLEKSRWQQFILKNKDFFGIDDQNNFSLEYQSFYGMNNAGEKVLTEDRKSVVQKFKNGSFYVSDIEA